MHKVLLVVAKILSPETRLQLYAAVNVVGIVDYTYSGD